MRVLLVLLLLEPFYFSSIWGIGEDEMVMYYFLILLIGDNGYEGLTRPGLPMECDGSGII